MPKSRLTNSERVTALEIILRVPSGISGPVGQQFIDVLRKLDAYLEARGEMTTDLKASARGRGVDADSVHAEVNRMITKVELVAKSMGIDIKELKPGDVEKLADAFEYPPMRDTALLLTDEQVVNVFEIFLKIAAKFKQIDKDSDVDREQLNKLADEIDGYINFIAIKNGVETNVVRRELDELLDRYGKTIDFMSSVVTYNESLARPIAKSLFSEIK